MYNGTQIKSSEGIMLFYSLALLKEFCKIELSSAEVLYMH